MSWFNRITYDHKLTTLIDIIENIRKQLEEACRPLPHDTYNTIHN